MENDNYLAPTDSAYDAGVPKPTTNLADTEFVDITAGPKLSNGHSFAENLVGVASDRRDGDPVVLVAGQSDTPADTPSPARSSASASPERELPATEGWISGGEQFLEKPLHERALGHEGRNDSGFISPEVAGATSQHNMHAEFQGRLELLDCSLESEDSKDQSRKSSSELQPESLEANQDDIMDVANKTSMSQDQDLMSHNLDLRSQEGISDDVMSQSMITNDDMTNQSMITNDDIANQSKMMKDDMMSQSTYGSLCQEQPEAQASAPSSPRNEVQDLRHGEMFSIEKEFTLEESTIDKESTLADESILDKKSPLLEESRADEESTFEKEPTLTEESILDKEPTLLEESTLDKESIFEKEPSLIEESTLDKEPTLTESTMDKATTLLEESTLAEESVLVKEPTLLVETESTSAEDLTAEKDPQAGIELDLVEKNEPVTEDQEIVPEQRSAALTNVTDFGGDASAVQQTTTLDQTFSPLPVVTDQLPVDIDQLSVDTELLPVDTTLTAVATDQLPVNSDELPVEQVYHLAADSSSSLIVPEGTNERITPDPISRHEMTSPAMAPVEGRLEIPLEQAPYDYKANEVDDDENVETGRKASLITGDYAYQVEVDGCHEDEEKAVDDDVSSEDDGEEDVGEEVRGRLTVSLSQDDVISTTSITTALNNNNTNNTSCSYSEAQVVDDDNGAVGNINDPLKDEADEPLKLEKEDNVRMPTSDQDEEQTDAVVPAVDDPVQEACQDEMPVLGEKNQLLGGEDHLLGEKEKVLGANDKALEEEDGQEAEMPILSPQPYIAAENNLGEEKVDVSDDEYGNDDGKADEDIAKEEAVVITTEQGDDADNEDIGNVAGVDDDNVDTVTCSQPEADNDCGGDSDDAVAPADLSPAFPPASPAAAVAAAVAEEPATNGNAINPYVNHLELDQSTTAAEATTDFLDSANTAGGSACLLDSGVVSAETNDGLCKTEDHSPAEVAEAALQGDIHNAHDGGVEVDIEDVDDIVQLVKETAQLGRNYDQDRGSELLETDKQEQEKDAEEPFAEPRPIDVIDNETGSSAVDDNELNDAEKPNDSQDNDSRRLNDMVKGDENVTREVSEEPENNDVSMEAHEANALLGNPVDAENDDLKCKDEATNQSSASSEDEDDCKEDDEKDFYAIEKAAEIQNEVVLMEASDEGQQPVQLGESEENNLQSTNELGQTEVVSEPKNDLFVSGQPHQLQEQQSSEEILRKLDESLANESGNDDTDEQDDMNAHSEMNVEPTVKTDEEEVTLEQAETSNNDINNLDADTIENTAMAAEDSFDSMIIKDSTATDMPLVESSLEPSTVIPDELDSQQVPQEIYQNSGFVMSDGSENNSMETMANASENASDAKEVNTVDEAAEAELMNKELDAEEPEKNDPIEDVQADTSLEQVDDVTKMVNEAMAAMSNDTEKNKHTADQTSDSLGGGGIAAVGVAAGVAGVAAGVAAAAVSSKVKDAPKKKVPATKASTKPASSSAAKTAAGKTAGRPSSLTAAKTKPAPAKTAAAAPSPTVKRAAAPAAGRNAPGSTRPLARSAAASQTKPKPAATTSSSAPAARVTTTRTITKTTPGAPTRTSLAPRPAAPRSAAPATSSRPASGRTVPSTAASRSAAARTPTNTTARTSQSPKPTVPRVPLSARTPTRPTTAPSAKPSPRPTPSPRTGPSRPATARPSPTAASPARPTAARPSPASKTGTTTRTPITTARTPTTNSRTATSTPKPRTPLSSRSSPATRTPLSARTGGATTTRTPNSKTIVGAKKPTGITKTAAKKPGSKEVTGKATPADSIAVDNLSTLATSADEDCSVVPEVNGHAETNGNHAADAATEEESSQINGMDPAAMVM